MSPLPRRQQRHATIPTHSVTERGARLTSARILKVLAGVGTAQVITMLVNLARTKLLAVLLGPAGVGVTSVIDQIVQVVLQVSALSLPFASIKFLSRAHSRGAHAFRRTYASLLGAVLGLTGAGALLALVARGVRPEVFGISVAGYGGLLLPALLAVPAMALHGLFVQVLAAARDPRVSALLTLIIAAGLTMAAYVGISLDGILGLYWATLACSYLVVGGMMWYLSRTLGVSPFDGSVRIAPLFEDNRDLFTFTLISYAMAVALPVSYGMLRYAVLHALGESAAGLLQAALLLSGAFTRLLNPMNGLYLTPIVNRDIPIPEKLGAAAEFQGMLMMLLGLLAVPVLLFSDGLVRLLFSASFVEIGSVVYLFVVAQCVALLAGVHQALLIGLDDLKMYGVLVGSSQLSLGVLAWVLVPRYGVLGAAIAVVISSVAVFGLTLARLRWKHGFAQSPRILTVMGSGVLALLVIGAWAAHSDPQDLLVMAEKVGVCLLFTSAILLFWRQEGHWRKLEHDGGPRS